MDDVWVRAGLVAAALLVVGVIVLILRRTPTPGARRIPVAGLDPGVYLFTSTACVTCKTAREELIAKAEEFVEIAWEEQPGIFADLEIDAVPAVLVVGEAGSGRLIPGRPGRASRWV